MKLTNVEIGFDPENVLTFQVATPTIPSLQRATFNESLADRLTTLPGVRFAGYALNLRIGSRGATLGLGQKITVMAYPLRANVGPEAPDSEPVVLEAAKTGHLVRGGEVTLEGGKTMMFSKMK